MLLNSKCDKTEYEQFVSLLEPDQFDKFDRPLP